MNTTKLRGPSVMSFSILLLLPIEAYDTQYRIDSVLMISNDVVLLSSELVS